MSEKQPEGHATNPIEPPHFKVVAPGHRDADKSWAFSPRKGILMNGTGTVFIGHPERVTFPGIGGYEKESIRLGALSLGSMSEGYPENYNWTDARALLALPVPAYTTPMGVGVWVLADGRYIAAAPDLEDVKRSE